MQDTKIIYDFDILTLKSKVVMLKQSELGNVVITEKTPFHPISYTWPDQPGDIGTINILGTSLKVINSIVGASNANNDFFFDKNIPVKRFEYGWSFFVCHIVEDLGNLSVGSEVTLHVDKENRHNLSLSHSAVHLAALALNKATKKFWKKEEFPIDGLGNPDFDKVAMQESKITSNGCFDKYRLGKSLKKKVGFNTELFFQEMPAIQKEINDTLKHWILTKAPIEVTFDGDTLRSNRYWNCILPEGKAKFPCGGTHATSLGVYKDIMVSFSKSNEEPEIVMQTTYHLSKH